MAARNRARNIEIANLWYQKGQTEFRAGDIRGAIGSFRNATTNDHDNTSYTMALATALAADDHTEEARQALLRLRASAPESGELNLSLARLAAREADMPDAVRYYRNALYGVWPPDRTAAQRINVRTELIRFLLAAHDNAQALSELLLLASETPDDGAAHDNVGHLFLQVGDSQHGLEEFTHALRLNGKDADAYLGAGRAAFDLGDYSKSRQYLESAIANGSKSAEASRLLETTRLIQDRDPLAPGLGTEERIRRLSSNLDYANDELQSCIRMKQDEGNSAIVLMPLLAELDGDVDTQFKPKALRADPEGFRTGLNLIGRIAVSTGQICGESSALHNALLRIAKKRGVIE